MSTYNRRALTASMVQIRFTSGIDGFEGLNESVGLFGTAEQSRSVIARAQSLSTSDSMPYARVKQIGYGSIVEDVPQIMESSGSLQVIETIDVPSLYRLGIYDFVQYLKSCTRKPLSIAIFATCNIFNTASIATQNTVGNLSGAPKLVDSLDFVKFTSVSRAIDVHGHLVSNGASFIFIRPIADM